MAGKRDSQRIAREMKTVRVMIEMYCRDRHGGEDLCTSCRALWEYAQQRVDHCPFASDKPTCLNCTVHCYKPAMREQIRLVMRCVGPSMAWRHPILALWHFLDGRREPPPKPAAKR
jgi:hypothetical protein